MELFFIIFSTFITILFGTLRVKYTYWELQGVKQLKTHFLFGNLFKFKTIHLSELYREVYQAFKGKAKVVGTYIYTKPIAVILDLDLAKTILIKDFNKFVDRFEYDNAERDPIAAHLFALRGEKWRSLRTKLTPTFTSGKMKLMFPTMISVAKEFKEAFEQEIMYEDGNIEVHGMIGRFTTDVIGSCVFGIECNSLKDPNVEFRQMGRALFYEGNYSIRLKLFIRTYENILKFFGVKRINKKIEEFFMRIVRETVELRERENIQRNDFINLLIEMKNHKDDEHSGLTIEQIASQVFLFFVAGFETSSSNMSYALFELAKHPEIQEKLRAEILSVLDRYDGVLSYEAMLSMPYLDQVISETLRKYPALAILQRIADVDYDISGTSITLQKGTMVVIPVKEIHFDPEIYDDPEKFCPDRFTPSEIQKRHPQAFLGFGDGPRNCIGLRFGRMQVRVGLITLLKSFKFHISEKMPKDVEFSKYNIIQVPADGVWIKAVKLNN